MEIYLVRHTTPDISKGICYGQSDISIASTFSDESKCVLAQLPTSAEIIYTSPLKRCLELAKLIPHQEIKQCPQLMEMNFGDWELKPWSGIAKEELTPWMEDFVHHQVPNGESMRILADRVILWYNKLLVTDSKQVVVVTHAGPIRVILSTIYKTPLEEAFERYQVDYGVVIAIGNSTIYYSERFR